MQKTKKVSVETHIKEKIKYLGLNFERVPKTLIATDNLNFKLFKGNDEKQYKQYKFIDVKDIDILLTPTHRLDSLNERYEKANPLYMYLDSANQENADKYATFLRMLKKFEITDVEKIEKEQKMLNEEIPYKVKFNGNYLWQIYYSESLDRFFMLLPTEDSDYSTFFYLLKKKIENKKNTKIFVPISYLDYSGDILKRSEIKDLENYLWVFTKDYPSIYEVYDKKQNQTLQIIGETKAYGKIKTLYKMEFDSAKEASKFYKLVKALFLLQVELARYYNFITNINEEGNLEFYLNDEKIEYEKLPKFVNNQFTRAIKISEDIEKEIIDLQKRLEQLKLESIKLERDYLEKEKMISTFLECKKTFFGKVKYFFTMGKKSKKSKNKELDLKDEYFENEVLNIEKNTKNIKKKNYTLDDLIINYKDLEIQENNKKSIVQDINALKLKNKNLNKKIENAISYINEINKHKRSIFEFWKYSNKDEVAALDEGEEEEINVKQVIKEFNYDEDFENFSEKVDKNQRLKFTDSELDGCYVASTYLLDTINDIHNKKNIELAEYSEILKQLKEENKEEFVNDEEFDIFGNDSRQINKERKLGNKTHRETPRDVYKILEIKKGMKSTELKKSLFEVEKNIKKALNKSILEEDIYVYKTLNKYTKLEALQIVSLNEDSQIKKPIFSSNKESANESTKKEQLNENNIINDSDSIVDLYLYKIKIPKGSNFVAFSNIVLYNNRNMTLPVGMQESSDLLLDFNEFKMKEINHKQVNVRYLENDKYDFSKVVLKKIGIIEYEAFKV